MTTSVTQRLLAEEIASISSRFASSMDTSVEIAALKELRAMSLFLSRVSALGVKPEELGEAIVLPANMTSFSDFIFVDECDSSNPMNWERVHVDGEVLRAAGGDLLVRRLARTPAQDR